LLLLGYGPRASPLSCLLSPRQGTQFALSKKKILTKDIDRPPAIVDMCGATFGQSFGSSSRAQLEHT
jgi:hypothetical protein